MKILISNRQKFIPLSFLSARAVVKSVLELENVKADEVSIHFVTKSQISKLHDQFFDDPTPTDCITLPMDIDEEDDLLNYRILGEIFVCPEIAQEYIQTKKLTLRKKSSSERRNEVDDSVYEEITLYVVHGILHLLRYDDIDPKDRKLMQKKETFHMNNLKNNKTLLRKCSIIS